MNLSHIFIAFALLFTGYKGFTSENTSIPSNTISQTDQAANESWEAIGLTVWDGNTLEISKDGKVYRLLLAHIIAPRRGQPFAKEAREALKEMVYGQKIHVLVKRYDRFGRIIADIKVAGRDINTEMVKQGYAWVYRRFNTTPELIALEDDAHKDKRGLWKGESPVAPWEYKLKNMAPTSQADAEAAPLLKSPAP